MTIISRVHNNSIDYELLIIYMWTECEYVALSSMNTVCIATHTFSIYNWIYSYIR